MMGGIMLTRVFRLMAVSLLAAALAGPAQGTGLNVFESDLAVLARTRLAEVARSPRVIAAVREQNRQTAQYTQEQITELDEQWIREAESGSHGPLIAGVLDHEVSRYLARLQDDSRGLFTEIILMDAVGLNVAVSRVTTDYWQGDEDKWQKTFLAGPHSLHIGPLEEDLSTRTVQSQVSLPVVDPQTGEPIGALTFGIDVEEL